MKKQFSTHWRKSKQARKKRKYAAKAPLHIKRRMLSANLNKVLRKQYNKRSLPVRKGDIVKVMRGKFKKKQGKVTEVKTKLGKIYIENLQIKKMDGSKANVPFKASNLQIIELNLDDKKRIKKLTIGKEEKIQTKKDKVKETKQIMEEK